MKVKSILTALLLMIAGLQSAQAQKMVIYKADKTTIELGTLDVDSIVFVESELIPTICPDNNHPHAIDLGLPSGTKWCCCNVGANTPEGYGGYYAWGETSEKSYLIDHSDVGFDIAGTDYDVAHVLMGVPWQMPSNEQQKELKSNCSCQGIKLNGVNGILVTGLNGGQIFLPAAGYRRNNKLNETNKGFYWSSMLESNDRDPFKLIFNSNGWDLVSDLIQYDSSNEFSVRAVYGEDTPQVKLVTQIVLSDLSLTLNVNDTSILTATVLPEDADNPTVTWESSDETVAKVSSEGLVTAIAEGTCTITCSSTDGSGVKAGCVVTVKNPLVGAWTCTEEYYKFSGASPSYETYTIILNEDNTATCSLYDNIGSWKINDDGQVTIDIMTIATQTHNAGAQWIGTIENISKPTRISGYTYTWNFNEYGYHKSEPHDIVMTKQ